MDTRQKGVSQKGTAMVEFALILPLLLLLTFVTTEFGRAIYQYNTITKSVRDAVRYLSLQTPGTHITEAQNLVVYGNIAGTGTPLALGLSTSNVLTPTWQTAGANPLINTVTVTVSGYKFIPLYSSVFGLAFTDASGKITYSNISATMRSSI
ncbi:TadZ/CpaE-like protein [Collimonas arenae]|uniref:TadZ/CpaE-like protein n=1 Tax=Collimonas arenae TaxID=279058 RepID=A0A0A1FGY2_9BURK|nr:TadE family protein [Collimonas arenae]AIY42965.1 TadZ/CpaE-like protein [Collimonas arenae]